MLGTAESWTVLEKYEIKGYKSFNKDGCKIIRYGRNPGWLVLYVTNVTAQYVGESVWF